MTNHNPNDVPTGDSGAADNSFDSIKELSNEQESELLRWPLQQLLKWTLRLYDAVAGLDNRFGSACEALRARKQELLLFATTPFA